MLNNIIAEQIKIFISVAETIWPLIQTIIAGFLLGRIFVICVKKYNKINWFLAIICFLIIVIFSIVTKGDQAFYSVYLTLGGVLLAEIIDQENPRYFEIIIALLIVIGIGFFIMGGLFPILIAFLFFCITLFLLKKSPHKKIFKKALQVNFRKMIDEVETLSLEELQQLEQVIQQSITNKEKTTDLTDIHQKLLATGLVKKIKKTSERPIIERKLIQVKGKPLSETIIEDRR